MVFIGSSLGAGTIPLINNQGQIVNPNPVNNPHSYGVMVAGTNQAPVIVGVSNPIVNNQNVVSPVSPVPQQIFIPPQYTVQQNVPSIPSGVSTSSPYNYGYGSGFGGGGSGDTNAGGGSLNLSTLILPLAILLLLIK